MNIFKVAGSVVLWMMLCTSVFAQDLKTREDFTNRYNSLVSRVGVDGVGVETLLDKWEAAFPDDVDMSIAKFSYYISKCKTSQIIQLPTAKYLGQEPILSLKDSTGANTNYFQDYIYDDELFVKAISYIDKAIAQKSNRLDLRFGKSAAYYEYEKESPDMALSFLKSLIDYNGQSKPKWEYPGYDSVEKDDFEGLIQQYCVSFYQLGSDSGWEAFKGLSEKMLQYSPKNPMFMDNIGSYYLAHKKDFKAAQKQYTSVLKIKPDDYTAIKNLVLMARSQKNTKLEKKYLPLLAKYTESEAEKVQAEARLSALK